MQLSWHTLFFYTLVCDIPLSPEAIELSIKPTHSWREYVLILWTIYWGILRMRTMTVLVQMGFGCSNGVKWPFWDWDVLYDVLGFDVNGRMSVHWMLRGRMRHNHARRTSKLENWFEARLVRGCGLPSRLFNPISHLLTQCVFLLQLTSPSLLFWCYRSLLRPLMRAVINVWLGMLGMLHGRTGLSAEWVILLLSHWCGMRRVSCLWSVVLINMH